MADICGDNRFEIIDKAKKHLLESTNIECREDEMKVLDNILFRCWQMGWLDRYDDSDSKKVIDEEKLDELADKLNPNNPHGDNYEVGQYFGFQDGFKAGYRKAIEE